MLVYFATMLVNLKIKIFIELRKYCPSIIIGLNVFREFLNKRI